MLSLRDQLNPLLQTLAFAGLYFDNDTAHQQTAATSTTVPMAIMTVTSTTTNVIHGPTSSSTNTTTTNKNNAKTTTNNNNAKTTTNNNDAKTTTNSTTSTTTATTTTIFKRLFSRKRYCFFVLVLLWCNALRYIPTFWVGVDFVSGLTVSRIIQCLWFVHCAMTATIFFSACNNPQQLQQLFVMWTHVQAELQRLSRTCTALSERTPPSQAAERGEPSVMERPFDPRYSHASEFSPSSPPKARSSRRCTVVDKMSKVAPLKSDTIISACLQTRLPIEELTSETKYTRTRYSQDRKAMCLDTQTHNNCQHKKILNNKDSHHIGEDSKDIYQATIASNFQDPEALNGVDHNHSTFPRCRLPHWEGKKSICHNYRPSRLCQGSKDNQNVKALDCHVSEVKKQPDNNICPDRSKVCQDRSKIGHDKSNVCQDGSHPCHHRSRACQHRKTMYEDRSTICQNSLKTTVLRNTIIAWTCVLFNMAFVMTSVLSDVDREGRMNIVITNPFPDHSAVQLVLIFIHIFDTCTWIFPVALCCSLCSLQRSLFSQVLCNTTRIKEYGYATKKNHNTILCETRDVSDTTATPSGCVAEQIKGGKQAT